MSRWEFGNEPYLPRKQGYDIAQICHNGHVITVAAISSHYEQQDFCDKCGASTIKTCPSCNAFIRGLDQGIGFGFTMPHYCYSCGKPYPWTKAKLEAIQELAGELDGLTEKEKAALKQSLEELTYDTPKTEVAAIKVKKFLAKASGSTLSVFREILVEIASETAKKAMGL